MKLENMPRAPDSDIIDLRKKTIDKEVDEMKTDPKGNLIIPDKTVIFTEDEIGEEMQPAMRGYGKVQKNIKQWRVR